jgi:hypothetical protein
MTPETRQIVRRYILSDFNGFIDRLIAATNLAAFKADEFQDAKDFDQRRICKLLENAGIELSAESMEILHETDLPEPEPEPEE